jgi:hypothetical protein
MRRLALLLLMAIPLAAPAQDKKPPTTLRGVLLEQLHTTHDQEDWFVPVNVAIAGLTADQAKWSPGKGNHSVGQLAYHIWYWNNRELIQFKGGKPAPFDGNNNETFDNFNDAQWGDLVKKLNQVMTDWEQVSRRRTTKNWRKMPRSSPTLELTLPTTSARYFMCASSTVCGIPVKE